jgi:ABC-2 type transport system ATP-binding protein
MRQRLVLAIALVGDPDLLILDEPSTGLDPNGAKEIRDIIRAENDRGTTVFFSSHVMEQVEAFCDRIANINRGQLVAVDTIDGLRDSTETGETLYLQVESLDNDTIEQIRQVDGVTSASLDDGQIRVTVGDKSKFRVLETIDDSIVPVRDFSVVTSSLGDLFIRYTNEKQEVRV